MYEMHLATSKQVNESYCGLKKNNNKRDQE